MHNSILYFEIRSRSINRFPNWLAGEIQKNNPDIESFFLCLEKISLVDETELRKSVRKSAVVNDGVGAWSVDAFEQILSKIRPNLVVVFAHRLPDIALLAAARNLNIATVYYQHGLYIPFMKREMGLFLSNTIKVFRYFCFAVSLSLKAGGLIPELIKFMQIFVTGDKALREAFPHELWLPDFCLVYGSYWKAYHVRNYGYREEQISVVGTPDLAGLTLSDDSSSQTLASDGTLCYVAQTLFEDGRISRKKMLTFLHCLAEAASTVGASLNIKLHPRSDVSLYRDLPGTVILSHDFLRAEIYVGHYSSLLLRGLLHTSKFIIIKLPGHKPPSYFDILDRKQIEANCTSSELAQVIDQKLKCPQDQLLWCCQKQSLDWYFSCGDQPPFARAAKKISEFLRSKV